MCFTYEVLETFCNLPILAANPKNCLHRTPHFPMTSQRAHPTAPNPRHSMAQRRVRSKHHTCTTPQRRARAFPHHCTRPLHDAGYVSSHGAVPVPRHAAKSHAAHSTALGASPPPFGTAPELPEVWKQKSDQNCNFFAIGNCRRCPNHGSSPENEANDRSVPHFHFTGDEKEPLIAKMLQKRQDFCFRKANYRNRSRFRNETIAKRGQIPR